MSVIFEVKTFSQIYEAMKKYLVGESSTLNNFNTGARLNTLLEGIAIIGAKAYLDFYQAMRKGIPTSIYDGFGFEKLDGNNASGKLKFGVSNPAISDLVIPAGTAVIINGINFETVEAGLIVLGETESLGINARCTLVGAQGNIAYGAIDTRIGQGSFINQPNSIEYCYNSIAFAGGTEEESDDARIQRFNAFINSLARSTSQGLLSAALSVPGVVSASLIENFPTYGWITIYADDGTGVLDPSVKSQILKVINGDPNDPVNYPGYRAAGIQVQVLAPIVQTVNINAQIKILNTALSDDSYLISLSITAIEQYVNSLGLGQDVILSEIVTNVQNAHSDIYDVTITVPASNVTITSERLARTGTVVVTSTRVGA